MARKKRYDFSELEGDAKQYIITKVKNLGSVEAVKMDYRLNDMVSAYAIQYAEWLFRKVRPKLSF